MSNLGDGSETDEWREGNAPCDARTACHRLEPRVLLPAAALEREDNFCSRESTKTRPPGSALELVKVLLRLSSISLLTRCSDFS